VKQSHVLLKLTVLASSLLLVGGCVSYRAGAFNWLMEPSKQPADAENSSPRDQKQSGENTSPPLTIMSGAKSSATGATSGLLQGITPADTPQQPPATKPPNMTLMQSSKGGFILVPESKPPDVQPPAPSQPSKPAP
jgi:hypothetical protein